MRRTSPALEDVFVPLLLVVLADFSYDGVAQALNVPYGTVCSRFSRARKKLREALGGVNPMLDQEGSTDE